MNLLSHMWLYSFSKLRAKFQDENQIWEQHKPILIYLGTEVEGNYMKSAWIAWAGHCLIPKKIVNNLLSIKVTIVITTNINVLLSLSYAWENFITSADGTLDLRKMNAKITKR